MQYLAKSPRLKQKLYSLSCEVMHSRYLKYDLKRNKKLKVILEELQHHSSRQRITRLRQKIPIGYNGISHIYPITAPFPPTISTPFNTPIPRPTLLTTQTAINGLVSIWNSFKAKEIF